MKLKFSEKITEFSYKEKISKNMQELTFSDIRIDLIEDNLRLETLNIKFGNKLEISLDKENVIIVSAVELIDDLVSILLKFSILYNRYFKELVKRIIITPLLIQSPILVVALSYSINYSIWVTLLNFGFFGLFVPCISMLLYGTYFFNNQTMILREYWLTRLFNNVKLKLKKET